MLAGKDQADARVGEAMISALVVAHPDEILRTVADRMAALGLGVLPVVDRADAHHLDGLITQFDLLEARQKAPRRRATRRTSADVAPSQLQPEERKRRANLTRPPRTRRYL